MSRSRYLYKQRRDSIVPLVSSPFIKKDGDEEKEDEKVGTTTNECEVVEWTGLYQDYRPGELKVYVHEVPTSDLVDETLCP